MGDPYEDIERTVKEAADRSIRAYRTMPLLIGLTVVGVFGLIGAGTSTWSALTTKQASRQDVARNAVLLQQLQALQRTSAALTAAHEVRDETRDVALDRCLSAIALAIVDRREPVITPCLAPLSSPGPLATPTPPAGR